MRNRCSFSVYAIACSILIGCGGGSGNKAGSGGSTGQGGTTPGSGGTTPGSGGTTPGSGGTTPGTGGTTPGSGGTTPGTGGSIPGSGGSIPGSGGSTLGSGGNLGIADAATDQPGANRDGPVASNSCPAFTPCGGDLIGTWNLASECISFSSTSGDCTLSMGGADISGLWGRYIFNADGTATFSMSGTTDVTLRYSAGCLLGSPSPEQGCADLQQAIVQQMGWLNDAGSPAVTVDKIECSMHEDACLCEEVIGRPEYSYTLGYTTSGNQLFIYPPGDAGAPDAISYCVSGNTLTIPMSSNDGYMTFSR